MAELRNRQMRAFGKTAALQVGSILFATLAICLQSLDQVPIMLTLGFAALMLIGTAIRVGMRESRANGWVKPNTGVCRARGAARQRRSRDRSGASAGGSVP
ncbi:MAG: hypothetical protein HC794_08175 [Nitrospiraceae bacterium]|nr:hypothetical protein [Nitrospiraceae bacterium]